MAARKVYTDEFKQESVQYIVDHPDMSMYAISKELKVSQPSLRSWSKQYNQKIDSETKKEPQQASTKDPEESNETPQRNKSEKKAKIKSTVDRPGEQSTYTAPVNPTLGDTYRGSVNPTEGDSHRPPVNPTEGDQYRPPEYYKQLFF